ncbi:TetR/AcrR family transcriptional regulator [Acetobacteraceae bacterium H6797]|nr:TetR/AcrR family transcriptional regulator [Acetobacteraceae bacterium H6797]
MRVSREQAAENRARIVAEASRLFREKGITGVGVDKLTEAAGLTHGSLYSQFGSKERLAAAALEHALSRGALSRVAESDLPPKERAAQVIDRYLSQAHRDGPGQGCAMAALASEIPRQGEPVRAAFAEGLRSKIESLAALLGESGEAQAHDEAMAMIASLVGALTLARAVDDEALSNKLLTATARSLKRKIGAA